MISNFFKKVSNRISAIAFLLLTVVLVFNISIHFTEIKDFERKLSTETLTRELGVVSNTLVIMLEEVENDIISLSAAPPARGIIRSLDNEGVDEQGNSTLDQWRKRLQEIFIGLSDSKKFYDQVRYLDEEGNEMVRVNLKDGFVDPVVDSQLQNKKNRYYFSETMELGVGEIYTSKIDLNREGVNNDISEPHALMFRYGIPVVDVKGDNRAAFVINANIGRIFDRLRLIFDNQEFYIIDESGYYLFHPDAEKLYGSDLDLGTGESFQKDYGIDILENITNQEDGYTQQEDGFLIFSKVGYEINPEQGGLYIVRSIKNDDIFSFISSTTSRIIYYDIIAMTVLMLLLLIFIRFITRPVNKILGYIHEVDLGNDPELGLKGKDELSEIGKAFKKSIDKINNIKNNIQKEVDTQTVKLKKQQELSNKQQKVVMSILEDIKQEKKITEQTKNKLDTILEAIPTGVFVTKAPTGEPEYINQAGLKLLNKKGVDSVGKDKYSELYSLMKEDGEEYPNKDLPLVQTLKTGKPAKKDDIFIDKTDGTRIAISAVSVPVYNKNNEMTNAIVVFYDKTEEHKIYKAKTEFVSLASHQLRTPLSAIGWYAELLEDNSKRLTKKQKEYLKEIRAGKERMGDLVSALLNTTRLELGTVNIESKDTDVTKITRTVLDEEKINIDNKDVKADIKFNKDVGVIQSDPSLVRIVMQNLISNAIKYNNEGGELKIKVSRKGKGKEFNKIKLNKDSVCIEVSDSGIGIPKEQQKKIFTKMFRADNVKIKDTEGTGLGLYLVKSIIKELGGDISFKSDEKGTTFYVNMAVKIEGKTGRTKIESNV